MLSDPIVEVQGDQLASGPSETCDGAESRIARVMGGNWLELLKDVWGR